MLEKEVKLIYARIHCWQLVCLFLEHFKGSTELLRSAHSVVNNEWAFATGLGDQRDCV
jgi:hypothetical protein